MLSSSVLSTQLARMCHLQTVAVNLSQTPTCLYSGDHFPISKNDFDLVSCQERTKQYLFFSYPKKYFTSTLASEQAMKIRMKNNNNSDFEPRWKRREPTDGVRKASRIRHLYRVLAPATPRVVPTAATVIS